MILFGGKLQESGPRTREDCPPRKTDLNSSPDSAQRPRNRPVAGNPQSRVVNRVPRGEVGRAGRNDCFIPEGTAESQGAPIRILALMQQSCRPGAAAVTECPSATCVDGNF